MISIRPYKKSDASRCCDIINECVKTMSGLNNAAREFIHTKNIPDILDSELSSGFSLVAENQNRVIGLGTLADNEIKRVYVISNSQGIGVGKELLQALEQEAQNQGYNRVTTESSPKAEGFYINLGYEPIEPVTYKRGDAKFECIKMVKRIVDSAS